MPFRKIPKNYLMVTGSFSSIKNGRMLGYESLLERDYMILLEYDDNVETFEEQPVGIPFRKGVKAYVPDLLIHFKFNSQTSQIRKPLLVDVKDLRDLEKNQAKYAPKFAAAIQYTEDRDWEFRLVTNEEIRIPRLDALKFLRMYLKETPNHQTIHSVIAALQQIEPIEINRLLDQLCSDDNQRLTLIPAIWHMVAKQQIKIDYDMPLSGATLLSLP